MDGFFGWVQDTGVATAVGESLLLTGALSAIHLIGFTLVTGGALVANLRMLGVLFAERPAVEVTRPAGRGVAVGLAISVATGLLLFAPRARDASVNSTFQVKMLLLALATVFHFTVHRRASRRPASPPGLLRTVGAISLLLWTGVALAGCAYILLE
jgi:hypothetical protein